mgnify:CR=1 FL=1
MFHTIQQAVEAIKNGEVVIAIDDEDRENEGDFVMAAEKVTPKSVNFMITEGRGLICTPIKKSKADSLNLPLMVPGRENETPLKTAFTVSIDIDNGSTGISTYDRAETLTRLANPQAKADDFVRPGHIFPLIAQDNGVLAREGHTEAAIDLCRLAGLQEVGVICEILNKDGTMARTPELKEMAKKLNLKIITIKDLIKVLEQK